MRIKFNAEHANRQFYMVFCPSGVLPSALHDTLDAATKEAERLAAVVGNEKRYFYVLETVRYAKGREFVPPVDVCTTPMHWEEDK